MRAKDPVTGRLVFQVYNALPPGCKDTIHAQALELQRKFGESSDVEELESWAWIWLGEHPSNVRQYWYTATDGETKFGYRQFTRDVRRVMVTEARRSRAQSAGYEPEDEVFYTPRQVEQWLPNVWHTEVLASMGTVDDGQPRARIDPSEGGDSMAASTDVRAAYRAVVNPRGNWEQALMRIYAFGYTHEEAASELGVSRQQVGKWVSSALRAICHRLNDAEPLAAEDQRRPGFTWADGPGTRQAMSNEQAIAALRAE